MDNLDEFAKELLKESVRVTKASNGLPQSGDEYEYYCSFPGFKAFTAKIGQRLHKLIQKLLQFEDVKANWSIDVDDDDFDEQFDMLVESNDLLLERVVCEICYNYTTNNEASGSHREAVVTIPPDMKFEVASWNKKEKHNIWKISTSCSIPRPQANFRDIVDNTSTPFIPLLFSKPNQLKPLPEVFNKLQAPISLQALIENSKEWSQSAKDRCEHPYLYEIQEFEPITKQTSLTDPMWISSKSPGLLEDTPLIMVDTLDQLQKLVSTLVNTTEFAVDLEHHSYRSYQGFVCLMQVSTRSCDYIIDTLKLRHHMQLLNEVFTDPKIVKVLHGADWDICWLQRDFGVYVVNLFDTGQASRVLQLPKYSLAFLLDYCCHVQADKQYQLADWRMRPLPPEMIKYAREDTHYLLFIYDRMKNELIRRSNANNNLLLSVVDRSRDIALKTYQKNIFREDDYLKLCNKFKRFSLNSHQLRCVQLLYQWRDHLARQEDESPGYVLPNHMLFQISEALPKEPPGVLACCNPVPTLLRQHLNEVFSFVEQARSQTVEATFISHTDPKKSIYNKEEEHETISEKRYTGKHRIIIRKVGVADPPNIIMKSYQSKTVPENVKKCFKNSELKFRNILGMFLPVCETTSLTQPLLTPNVSASFDITNEEVSSVTSNKVMKKKPTKRHAVSLLDDSSQPIKKSKPSEKQDFNPFEYKSGGFSKVTAGENTLRTEEFHPRSISAKNLSKRTSVKMKSSRTITSKTEKSNKSISFQWPT